MGKHFLIVLVSILMCACSGERAQECTDASVCAEPFILGKELRPPEQMEDLLERERELQE